MMPHNHLDQIDNAEERTEYIAAVMGYYRGQDELRDVRENSGVALEEEKRGVEERVEMEQDVHERNKERLAKVTREWFAVQSLSHQLS